jgi:integrase
MAIVRTVQDVIDKYLQHMQTRFSAGDIGSLTMGKATGYLTEFGRMFGKQKLATAKRNDLTEFVAAHPKWESGWTKNDAIGQVVSCFKWAADEELIDRLVYRRPRTKYITRPRLPMSETEYTNLHVAAMAHGKRSGRRRRVHKNPSGRSLRRCLYFLRRTGCRTCELREMRWRDVDWEAGVVRLSQHKTARTGFDRIIGMDPATIRFLRNIYRQRSSPPDDQHVFLNARGKPLTRGSFARVLRAFARKAGVREEVSAYSIRHLFTVTAIENGIGERQVADQLGHTSTRFVAWYGRQTRANGNYLSNVVGQILRRPRPERRQGDAAR